jgi:hypothetical protein
MHIDLNLYSKIIRYIHSLLKESLLSTGSIDLPYGLGRFEIKSHNGVIYMKDNKVKRSMAVNWEETLKYWFSNENGEKKKILIYNKQGPIYRVVWVRKKLRTKNLVYYSFNTSRTLKKELKQQILNKGVPAYEQRFHNDTRNS